MRSFILRGSWFPPSSSSILWLVLNYALHLMRFDPATAVFERLLRVLGNLMQRYTGLRLYLYAQPDEIDATKQ